MPTDCRNTLRTIRSGMEMPRNQHEAVVVSEDEIFGVWLEHKVESGQMSRADADAAWKVYRSDIWPDDPAQRERVNELMVFALGNVSSARSGVDALRLAADFKGLGQYYVESYAGKNYIIFKGWPAGRTLIRGTRYLADNPRVVSLGIGRLGIKETAKTGARVTFVLIGAYRVFQYLTNDKFTLTRLFGTLATDIIKISASGIFAAFAGGLLTAGAAGAVVGPLVAAVAVGVISGLALEAVDKDYQLTDRLVWQMENTLRELGEIDTWACRAREAAENALVDFIDSVATAIVAEARRRGEAALRELIGPTIYTGWMQMPVFR